MAGTPWNIAAFAVRLLAGLVLIYLVLPTFVILPLSFSSESFLSFPPPGWSLRWYEELATQQDYVIALMNSLKIGLPAAALATVLGTMAALSLSRGRLPGRDLMTIIVIAPLILPPIVLAIALFPIMVRLGLIGTYPAILFGHVVVSTPLVFITVAAALRSYSPNFELAAMTLGANQWDELLARNLSHDPPRRVGRLHLCLHLLLRRDHPCSLPYQFRHPHLASPALGAAEPLYDAAGRRRHRGHPLHHHADASSGCHLGKAQ